MSQTLELPDAVFEALQQEAASGGLTPADWIVTRLRDSAELHDSFQVSLERMKELSNGWNGYSAPAPSASAISAAERYLLALRGVGWQPDRVEPSAMGGVGITHRRNGRKVYVEFYNNGKIHALFSERADPPRMSTQPVDASSSFEQFIEQARSYFHASIPPERMTKVRTVDQVFDERERAS